MLASERNRAKSGKSPGATWSRLGANVQRPGRSQSHLWNPWRAQWPVLPRILIKMRCYLYTSNEAWKVRVKLRVFLGKKVWHIYIFIYILFDRFSLIGLNSHTPIQTYALSYSSVRVTIIFDNKHTIMIQIIFKISSTYGVVTPAANEFSSSSLFQSNIKKFWGERKYISYLSDTSFTVWRILFFLSLYVRSRNASCQWAILKKKLQNENKTQMPRRTFIDSFIISMLVNGLTPRSVWRFANF